MVIKLRLNYNTTSRFFQYTIFTIKNSVFIHFAQVNVIILCKMNKKEKKGRDTAPPEAMSLQKSYKLFLSAECLIYNVIEVNVRL